MKGTAYCWCAGQSSGWGAPGRCETSPGASRRSISPKARRSKAAKKSRASCLASMTAMVMLPGEVAGLSDLQIVPDGSTAANEEDGPEGRSSVSASQWRESFAERGFGYRAGDDELR